MRVSFFIARRIAFNKASSFSRFIITIATAATAISVAVMILATALVTGFQQTIQDKIFSFWGHLHVNLYQPNASPLTEQPPIFNDANFRQKALALPGVTGINTFATKSVLVKAGKDIEGMIFKGVGPDYNWQNIGRFLQEGRLIKYNDSAFASEVLVSAGTATLLNLKLNDPIIVYFVRGGGLPPRARKLTIVGIYKTGIEEYDKTYFLGDLQLIRKLNEWEDNQIGGYEIFLKDYTKMDETAELLVDFMPEKQTVRTMKDIYPNIFDWLALQNKNEVIILIIMTIVAIINMVTAILILILERTNMVGILKALGMHDNSLQEIFVFQSAYIVLTGVVIGNVIGLGLAFLQQQTGFFKLPEESYYMSVAPIALQWWKVALINVGTLVICTVILYIPSILIRKIVPVRAIQFK
ncbi:ABC transporter permease [Chitinophaga horti]|uniref:ABC transporter permease n=1 Tax=Chitinophaga horti TaxID=2920382 RepID=A0ABY6J268_9BACT|nr:FtsX-like permease family protein [Chitinophaga horti]UYQ93747.1 ABC transporter permease [Chitinophaga horti]